MEGARESSASATLKGGATSTSLLAAERTLDDLRTPSLLLDEARMMRNIRRLRERLGPHNVRLNPHLKTCKALEVALRLMQSPQGPCTVSTLAEAECMAAAGAEEILYAVGIAPQKLPCVGAIRRSGADLVLLLDSIEQARAVAEFSSAAGDPIPAFIEIDVDGHRSGIAPDDDASLIAVARVLEGGGARLRGVLTHAGGSYSCPGADALRAIAEVERAGAVAAAETLRKAGFDCPEVSVGSTPTAHFVDSLAGVTEVRAGVFVFFDLVMAGLEVCTHDDIALSVLATVVGHQRAKGTAVVDAGWMAMSRDRGTFAQAVDQGYGLVCDLAGRPFGDLIMIEASQEHGILAPRDRRGSAALDLPIGARVRILPNHACATGAQHSEYRIISEDGRVKGRWPRFGGW